MVCIVHKIIPITSRNRNSSQFILIFIYFLYNLGLNPKHSYSRSILFILSKRFNFNSLPNVNYYRMAILYKKKLKIKKVEKLKFTTSHRAYTENNITNTRSL